MCHKYILILFASNFLWKSSCTNTESKLETIVKDYYQAYSTQSLEKWISYYDEEAIIHDISTDVYLKYKDSIYVFVKPVFDGQVELYNDISWEIEQIIVEDQTAVVKGKISNTKLQGKNFSPWQFTSWIKFNDQNKIINQQDFVNYPKELMEK